MAHTNQFVMVVPLLFYCFNDGALSSELRKIFILFPMCLYVPLLLINYLTMQELIDHLCYMCTSSPCK
jgi:hypothetical protein